MKRSRIVAALAIVVGTVLSAAALSVPAGAASRSVFVADVGPYTAENTGVVITNAGVTGRAQITQTASGDAIVRVEAEGLAPGSEYGAHVHFGRCTQYQGHFKYPSTGSGRSNEIWLDLVANAAGHAQDSVTVAPFDATQALSFVIHQNGNPSPGPRIACGDFAPAGS